MAMTVIPQPPIGELEALTSRNLSDVNHTTYFQYFTILYITSNTDMTTSIEVITEIAV